MILWSLMIPQLKSILIGNNRLQTKLLEGNVFTRVSLSRRSSAIPPWNRSPLGADPLPSEGIWDQTGSDIIPRNHRSGWYSSYWNAFLLYGIIVTGPPGALLFDRDQRSHWNNHYNCCFVRVATLGIYCTVFLPQMLIQVRYPMQSVGHHIWQ